jgi:hypothetical protein
MCVSCGCGRYEDNHGDERNVTVFTLQAAADASNLTLNKVIQNMSDGSSRMLSKGAPMHQSQGQAIESRLHPD